MINIIQGSIKTFTVLLTKQSNGEPFPLTGATEISTCFQNADGSELMLTMTGGAITIVNAAIGKLQVVLTSAQTAALSIVDSETLEIGVDFGAGPQKCQILNAYAVLQTVC